MTDLELPSGDVVSPGDLLLHDGYPYRYRPVEDERRYAFVFSPLFWGDSGMDVPFADREALAAQWSDESRGVLTEEEWAAWLEDARADDRFDREELATLAEELPVDDDASPRRPGAAGSDAESADSLLGRLVGRLTRG